jgi:uncharacterized SAM-binding protein YcdF (DUF218 family)
MRVGVLTPADAAASTSLIRVMEAIRLWKGMPEAGLVLSGGALAKRPAVAQVMAAVTYELGIPRESVTLEAESLDTDDEARLLKPMLGKAPFAMVTSASHMPRAMMIFRRHGMNPISAPADFEASSPQSWEPRMFVPAVSALLLSHKAFHEYMGIAVVTLKNVTGPTVGK